APSRCDASVGRRKGNLPPTALRGSGVDLGCADLSAVEVHRTGESITAFGHVLATDDVDRADDPLIAIVVHAGIQEFHPAPGEAVTGLPADRILAHVDSLLGGKTAGRTIGIGTVAAVALVDSLLGGKTAGRTIG